MYGDDDTPGVKLTEEEIMVVIDKACRTMGNWPPQTAATHIREAIVARFHEHDDPKPRRKRNKRGT